jgi:hypothetical protein|tara:strand:- start:6451 stop:6720 length:270 start_codon:yes stop_codon:yes gene_type:complete
MSKNDANRKDQQPSGWIFENISTEFDTQTSKSIALSGAHVKPPHVTATATGADSGDVNVFCDITTPTSITIRTSAIFTGTIYIHAVSTL